MTKPFVNFQQKPYSKLQKAVSYARSAPPFDEAAARCPNFRASDVTILKSEMD
jgi:hypothetical protein